MDEELVLLFLSDIKQFHLANTRFHQWTVNMSACGCVVLGEQEVKKCVQGHTWECGWSRIHL